MEGFKILGQLGQGTFGSVKLGLHMNTDEYVAIKTISKKKLKNKQEILMVERQISIAKCVSHPNLIKLFELIEEKEYLHLVMDYACEGDLLAHLKKHGPLKELEAFSIMKQIAQGVNYMHENKIAHRDIKLANILRFKDNKVKLADFGLSSFYETYLHTSCGSPCFAAPEVLQSKTYDPKAADIWSLGVVFYSLIEGSLPFYDEKIKNLFVQVTNGKYHPTKRMKKSLELVIKSLLHPNPKERLSLRNFINFLNIKSKQINHQNYISHVFKSRNLPQSKNFEEDQQRLIVKILSLHQFPLDKIKECLEANGKELTTKSINFNGLNTFYQLLKRKSVEKLKQMLSNLRNQEKQNSFLSSNIEANTSLKLISLDTPQHPKRRKIERTGSVCSSNESFTSNKRIARRKTMDQATSRGKNKLLKNQKKEFQTEKKLVEFKDSYIKIKDISLFSSLDGQNSTVEESLKLNQNKSVLHNNYTTRLRALSSPRILESFKGNLENTFNLFNIDNVYKGPYNLDHTIQRGEKENIQKYLQHMFKQNLRKNKEQEYEIRQGNEKTKLILSKIENVAEKFLLQTRPFNHWLLQDIKASLSQYK